MRSIRVIVCFLIFTVSGAAGHAQIPGGTWRDHLPYNHAKRLADDGNKIYCATSDGGLFSFSRKDNSLDKYSKVAGLSDADVSTVGYSAGTATVFIGYTGGNIDLVRNDSIINIPDIKRKALVGDKSVNAVYFRDQLAYLACGFGIVVCDLVKREIKDSYLFGEGGTQIRVHDITSDGVFLYAATAGGIYQASLNSPNLVDFNAWVKLDYLPVSATGYRFVAWHNNSLMSIYRNPATGFDDIISISANSWDVWVNSENDYYDYLGEQNGNLVICSQAMTRIYNNTGQLIREAGSYYARHALYDGQQEIWYAEPESGLIRINAAGNASLIVPDGPAYREVGDIEIRSGQLWAGGGTDESKWKGYGAYSFADEDWKNHNRFVHPELEGFLNISEISINPLDSRHVLGGSYGYGVVEFRNGEPAEFADETNSVLEPVPGYGHGYVLVTGTDFDPSGTAWLATNFSDHPVYRKIAGGEWESVALDYNGFGVDTRISGILAAGNGQVWLLIQNSGILVFRDNGDGTMEERFFSAVNQIPNLLDRIFSIAADKEGNIWVGTSKGPVIYFDPESIFEAADISGYQPQIPRNDGTPFSDLLLSTEKINAISVDGADQKWLATEKSGVFLLSADGKKEILHFTEDNSPLLSNNVMTVAVNDVTGEVFFGTDKGIISYRGQATEGSDDFEKVYVFPNPVRENFSGDITITGLVRDVNVKITDISGNLVYETKALGGQAIWNGRNFRGDRVQTGVYLVFCTNDDGSKTHVTKLLFIH